jgi:sugar phosphate isomerase/epimerase
LKIRVVSREAARDRVRFGLSTYLYHAQRLSPAHLAEVAAHGFMLVELCATRTHFDYRNAADVRDLGKWLTQAGLFLHSVHAPFVESYVDGAWGPPVSIAAVDPAARGRAVDEVAATLALAEVVPYEFLVVHLGVPAEFAPPTGDNSVDAARRSVEELHGIAARYGVKLALELIPNRISTVDALVRLIDEDLDIPDVGICLDYGHAFLGGDVADTIEAASGHLLTTHVHDNDGKRDAHLPPFDGRIDWETAVMTTQKVGYEGVWLLELAGGRDSRDVLARAAAACRRIEAVAMMQD